MKDNYEEAYVVEFGSAEQIVTGTKPRANEIESMLGQGYSVIILPDDIDESDY